MIDAPGLKTSFVCHHPASARWGDVWVEGCSECRELRLSQAFHEANGKTWDPYWPPVHRVQILFEGVLSTYSLRGCIVESRRIADELELAQHAGEELDPLLFDVQRANAEYRQGLARQAPRAELARLRMIVLGALQELMGGLPASSVPSPAELEGSQVA